MLLLSLIPIPLSRVSGRLLVVEASTTAVSVAQANAWWVTSTSSLQLRASINCAERPLTSQRRLGALLNQVCADTVLVGINATCRLVSTKFLEQLTLERNTHSRQSMRC